MADLYPIRRTISLQLLPSESTSLNLANRRKTTIVRVGSVDNLALTGSLYGSKYRPYSSYGRRSRVDDYYDDYIYRRPYYYRPYYSTYWPYGYLSDIRYVPDTYYYPYYKPLYTPRYYSSFYDRYDTSPYYTDSPYLSYYRSYPSSYYYGSSPYYNSYRYGSYYY